MTELARGDMLCASVVHPVAKNPEQALNPWSAIPLLYKLACRSLYSENRSLLQARRVRVLRGLPKVCLRWGRNGAGPLYPGSTKPETLKATRKKERERERGCMCGDVRDRKSWIRLFWD